MTKAGIRIKEGKGEEKKKTSVYNGLIAAIRRWIATFLSFPIWSRPLA